MHIFHFFIPHRKNNHRAKLLHNISLFILILAIGITSTVSVVLYRTYPQVLGISYEINNEELLNLTNFERQKEGLKPLKLNSLLSQAASKKGDHMFRFDYWAHFAPDGTSPWDFIKGEGYDYSYAGENLAKGFTTSYDAVSAWMNSPTHKANILSKNYSDVGFAISEGRLQGEDTVLIVQEFGSRIGYADSEEIPSNEEVQGSYQKIVLPEEKSLSFVNRPIINIGSVAKIITMALLSALLLALILDFIIIEKKKIPRAVGNNLDHIMLISIFLAFLFMARVGHII